MWIAALLLRVAIASIPGGNPYDQTCFKAWGIDMLRHGPATFYDLSASTIPCDYPPLYLYLLWFWAGLYHLIDPQIMAWTKSQIELMSPMNAWFKLPGGLADLLNGWLILRLLKPLVGTAQARAGAGLYLFNPLFLYDSVYWGQMDALLLSFMLLILLALRSFKLVGAAAWGTLAVLLKPQGLFLLPFVLVTQARRSHGWRWLGASGLGLLLSALILRPFWPMGGMLEPYQHFIRLMQETANHYPYGAMNAFNLHALGGMNQPDSRAAFGVTQQAWGIILVALVQLALGLKLRKSQDSRMFFLGAFLSVGAFFLFATRMHERYFIPALGLMTLAVILDPRLKPHYWMLCAVSILNLLYAQDSHVATVFDATGITILLSMANLGLFAQLAWRFMADAGEKLPAREETACVS